MWYSLIKTGDAEIDAQHANIDAFLMRINDGGSEIPLLLGKLIDALQAHFDSEEAICERRGYAMDDQHRAEHRRLAILLDGTKEDVLAGNLDTVMAVYVLKGILCEHIREFDAGLCDRE